MAQVTNVKTVKTKEQNGVLVEYLVENYGQSADFFVPDGAILDGQIDSRRVRSGMPVEYMSKDGKDFDWGQYSEDVEIQKRIANAFVYSFATFRKQGRGLYIYSSTKGSGKTLLACCLANEVLKKQDVSIKFATVADYIELVRSSKNEAVKEQMNAIMNTGLLIVDDIGATKEDKDWISDAIYRLVNRRYENMLPTIYTSNVMIEDNVKVYRKRGTWQTYTDMYDSAIKDEIGRIQLQDLTLDIIEKMYKRIQKKRNYSKSTMVVISCIVHGSLAAAKKRKLIGENVAEGAEIPKKTKAKKERIALTREQQTLFMEYAKDSYLYNLFAILLRTGLRNGEIRALKYSDIDRKNNVMHIRHTMKTITGVGMVEDTPKTKTSIRDIPLTPDMIKYIEAQRHFWGFKVTNINGYLFCDEKGDPLKEDTIKYEIRQVIKKIRQDGKEFPDITPHVFRHTFATRAIEEGMPPQVLKTIMGHSSLAITMDLYSHVMEDTKQKEMLSIANAF